MDDKELIAKAAKLLVEASQRHGVSVGYWDSWIGFGKFVSVNEEGLIQFMTEDKLP